MLLSFPLKFDLQVKDVEDQLSQRKAEVEKLIQEMREVNMESLAISPPEESKQFLDGIYDFSNFRAIFSSPLYNILPNNTNVIPMSKHGSPLFPIILLTLFS